MTKTMGHDEHVIHDGKYVGNFEGLYQHYEFPWNQNREIYRTDKALALNLIRKYSFKKVIELGCGFGFLTKSIYDLGVESTGIDISPTAIRKAKLMHPECNFLCGDITDFNLFQNIDFECIIMPEITWYVLPQLESFLSYMKSHHSNAMLIHILSTYPPGVQQYGCDKFTNLQEILAYFDLNYEEYGEIFYKDAKGGARTYFAAFLSS